MRRLMRFAVATGVLAGVLAPASALAFAPVPQGGGILAVKAALRARLSDQHRLSQGLRAWLYGPQRRPAGGAAPASIRFGSNIDAASVAEDTSYGQSETAIAAQPGRGGRHLVLAGWNDATGLSYTDSTKPAASVTGAGLSADGGSRFTDLVGLPNNDVDQQWFGDPSIVSLRDGSHFVVGSLYFPSLNACADGLPAQVTVAVTVGTVNAAGTGVTFTPPIVVTNPGNICGVAGHQPPPNLATLDKDFLAYDPASRTLAVSYTRFFISGHHSGLGQIEAARAHVPAHPTALSPRSFGAPIVVWPEEPFCPPGTPSSEVVRCGAVNQGSYPAVAPNGDVYITWERNWNSNLFDGDPYVYEHAARIPAGSRTVSAGGPLHPVVVSAGQPHGSPDHLGVKSLDGVAIPGYSRGLGNDFPRLAFDRAANVVVFVWNDASLHPLGDIWLRTTSPSLRTLGSTHKVNDDSGFSLHFLPAVSVRTDGTVCTSWYDRRLGGPTSALTDYFGDCRPAPGVSTTNFRITTGSTDWTNTSSLINPNFGDYTDNATDGTSTYFTWSDGRISVPQPFVAR